MADEEQRSSSRGEASNLRIINSNGQDLLRVWEVISAIVTRLKEVGFDAIFECSLGTGHHLNEFESSKIPPGKHNEINIYIKVRIRDSIEDFHSTFHFVRENRYGGADGKFHSKSKLTPSIERAIFEYIPGTAELVFLSVVPAQSGIYKFTMNPTQHDRLAEIRCRNAHHLIFQCVEAVLKEDNNDRRFSDNVGHALTAVLNVGKIQAPMAAAAAAGAAPFIDTYRDTMDLDGLDSPIIAASNQKLLAYEKAVGSNAKAAMRRAEADARAAEAARSATGSKPTSLAAMAARARGSTASQPVSKEAQKLDVLERFRRRLINTNINTLEGLLKECETETTTTVPDNAHKQMLCHHLKVGLLMKKKTAKDANIIHAIDERILELQSKIDSLSGAKCTCHPAKKAAGACDCARRGGRRTRSNRKHGHGHQSAVKTHKSRRYRR